MVTAIRRSLKAAGAASQRIVVGLSGGADSVALLAGLVALAKEQRATIVAAHLDHALREDSAADAAFCASLCARLGVPLRSERADVEARARREGRGTEDAARRERYAYLRRVAREEGASFILVAHNRNDQAETFLLRLLRGSGSRGLGAMRPRRGRLLRPLLDVPRQDILAYLQARGLRHLEDPSNRSPAYVRNRVRHELLPLLATFNPRVVEALSRAARLLAEDEQALARPASVFPWSPDGPGVSTPVGPLEAAPPAVVARAIRRGLRTIGAGRGLGAQHLETLVRLARSKRAAGRRIVLPAGYEAFFDAGLLHLGPTRTA